MAAWFKNSKSIALLWEIPEVKYRRLVENGLKHAKLVLSFKSQIWILFTNRKLYANLVNY